MKSNIKELTVRDFQRNIFRLVKANEPYILVAGQARKPIGKFMPIEFCNDVHDIQDANNGNIKPNNNVNMQDMQDKMQPNEEYAEKERKLCTQCMEESATIRAKTLTGELLEVCQNCYDVMSS